MSGVTRDLSLEESAFIDEWRLHAANTPDASVHATVLTGSPRFIVWALNHLAQAHQAFEQHHDGQMWGFAMKLSDDRTMRRNQHQMVIHIVNSVLYPMPYETETSPVFSEVDDRFLQH